MVLGNLHATAQGPTDDDVNGDVQFMHTFVLERGTASSGGRRRRRRGPRRLETNRNNSQLSTRCSVGWIRWATRARRAGRPRGRRRCSARRNPRPRRARGGARARGDATATTTRTSDGETSSVEKSPKMAKNGGQTPAADGPEDGGDSPESTKTRKTPPADDGLDDSVDEADVWLTNPMYGDVPESNPVPRDAQTGDHNTQTETPRAVRRAPGSAEVVPESPAINFASPNPFEDEAEGGGEGGEAGCRSGGCVPSGAPTAVPGARDAADVARREFDSVSVAKPPRRQRPSRPRRERPPRRRRVQAQPRVQAVLARARGRGNQADALRRVAVRQQRPRESTRHRRRRRRRRFSTTTGRGFGRTVTTTEPAACRGGGDAEQERRARRKERSVAGPPSSRYRRRVYSSASSSPAMSHAAGPTSAAPSPGFEPGTSGFDRNASPAAKRGLNARFQYDAQPWASAEGGSRSRRRGSASEPRPRRARAAGAVPPPGPARSSPWRGPRGWSR